ncbi:MAG TPA: pyridoxal-phosphate dependent enzyme [Solirubrobacterales bacterium]
MDLSLTRIEAAVEQIDPVFLDTPQFVSDPLSERFGREVLVKVETLNPIGSFKGRGTWLLARELDPSHTWVCATAGNFGQGLAYAARNRGASVHIFVGPDAPEGKVARMRALGAEVEVHERPESAASEYVAAGERRYLVVDGFEPAIAEGAGTIGVELGATHPIDTAVIQLGDGALITGIARWLKSRWPDTRVVGVCASGAPAMAESFAAGRPISMPGEGTIAGALAIIDPVPESFARIVELVDEVVLVDDDEIQAAMALIAESTGVLVEPAGAAGVAALARHETLAGERVGVLLTGAAA